MSNTGRPVARAGDNVLTGHGCDTTTQIDLPKETRQVIVCGQPAAVVGDFMKPHTIGSTPPFCNFHSGAVVNAGSATVLVGGKPLARQGDSADLGTITNGCTSVLAG